MWAEKVQVLPLSVYVNVMVMSAGGVNSPPCCGHSMRQTLSGALNALGVSPRLIASADRVEIVPILA